MHANIRVPKDQYIWEPAFIVMPHAGKLEIEFDNQDQNIHMALLPSNGARELLYLPIHERGSARIELDQPGLYWFGCPVANHAGRGMLGFIWVYGKTPEEARLDRPKQPQPQDD
jgi:PQQ system protein